MIIVKGQEANNLIGEKLKNEEVFQYGRFGMGFETSIPFQIEHGQPWRGYREKAHVHSGLYGDESDIKFYIEKFYESIKNRDMFLLWAGSMMQHYEDYFMNKFPSDKAIYVDAGTNESFRYTEPFSQYFEGKKVLVVNNFISSIEKQWGRKNELFKDPKVLPDFELVTYRTYSSFLGQRPHSGWKETYETMVDDISKLDFDISLVGCGSYGQPLTNFITTEMKKTAINTAGGTPLFFGVMGKRWQSDIGLREHLIYENWITPLSEETPNNNQIIEGGCYW